MFMKLRIRTFIRIAVVCLTSLCLVLGFYSYYRLQASESQHDFDLYTLVPASATAVFETHRLAEWFDDIDQLQSSKERKYLHVSELFTLLKQNYRALMDDTPHGLSKQMNQMLISFHEPDTPANQVLYCSLGREDGSLIRRMVEKYTSGSYPPKVARYRGEKLRIYPLADGRFLNLYVTNQFLVLSFQKRLLEEVVDAAKDNTSLLANHYFRSLQERRQTHVGAALYVRMKRVQMGSVEDTLRTEVQLGTWAEFELKLSERAVYAGGISQLADSDSVHSFAKVMSAQQPIEGFPGYRLPGSTFCFDHWALSDRKAFFDFTARHTYAHVSLPDEVKARDARWLELLDASMADRATTCLFTAGDSLSRRTCVVSAFPLREEVNLERELQPDLVMPLSSRSLSTSAAGDPRYDLFPRARGIRCHLLRPVSLLRQLTGVADSTWTVCAAVHRGSLLLAADAFSLAAYMDAMEQEHLLENHPLYQEAMSGLASSYSFLMMADMRRLLRQPEQYARLVPRFFYHHADFFRHFILAVQYTFADDMAYPNLVLLHK